MIAIDMPMPENCVECRFSQGDCGICHAMTKNFCEYVYGSEDEGRPGWCPLIPIIETHYKDDQPYRMVVNKKWRMEKIRSTTLVKPGWA